VVDLLSQFSSGVQYTETQYINALVQVTEDYNGKKVLDVLTKTIVSNKAPFQYDLEEYTLDLEYEIFDEVQELELYTYHTLFIETTVETSRDYWGEYDTEFDIKQFVLKDVTEKYKENEKYFQFED